MLACDVAIIKDFFQGKWLGHPLHPALVHVPTGLLPAALVFDVISLIGSGSNVAVRTAFWCIAVGIAAALAAAPAGLADWWDIKPEKPAHKLGLWHAILNVIALLIFIVSFALRLRAGLHLVHSPAGAFILTIAGDAILIVSGYLGGRMVYEHGISVARQSKKKWRKIAEDGHAHLPAEQGSES